MQRRRFTLFAAIAAVWLAAAVPWPASASSEKDSALSDEAAAHAFAGDIIEASRAAGRIDRLDLRDRAFARVAVILTRFGKEKAGLVALSRISDAGRRDDAMVDMGIQLARRGLLAEAGKLASRLDPWRRDRVRAAIGMTQGERGAVRQGRLTARRTSDLPRRRESMNFYRGGLARSLSASEAIGYARGAETMEDQVLSMLAVARRLVLDGKPAEALPALTWVRENAAKTTGGTALAGRAAEDASMLLLHAGDLVGARAAAAGITNGGVRRFVLRQIDEMRNFLP